MNPVHPVHIDSLETAKTHIQGFACLLRFSPFAWRQLQKTALSVWHAHLSQRPFRGALRTSVDRNSTPCSPNRTAHPSFTPGPFAGTKPLEPASPVEKSHGIPRQPEASRNTFGHPYNLTAHFVEFVDNLCKLVGPERDYVESRVSQPPFCSASCNPSSRRTTVEVTCGTLLSYIGPVDSSGMEGLLALAERVLLRRVAAP